jgi:hypothetical protein
MGSYVYGLGAILYPLLAGRANAANGFNVVLQHLKRMEN